MKNNTVPDITNPLGRHWEQPSRANILIDGDYAVMTERTLLSLYEYSTSCPSGVYEGKMWRALGVENTWFLRWYGYSEDENRCSINTREVLIV